MNNFDCKIFMGTESFKRKLIDISIKVQLSFKSKIHSYNIKDTAKLASSVFLLLVGVTFIFSSRHPGLRTYYF